VHTTFPEACQEQDDKAHLGNERKNGHIVIPPQSLHMVPVEKAQKRRGKRYHMKKYDGDCARGRLLEFVRSAATQERYDGPLLARMVEERVMISGKVPGQTMRIEGKGFIKGQ